MFNDFSGFVFYLYNLYVEVNDIGIFMYVLKVFKK